MRFFPLLLFRDTSRLTCATKALLCVVELWQLPCATAFHESTRWSYPTSDGPDGSQSSTSSCRREELSPLPNLKAFPARLGRPPSQSGACAFKMRLQTARGCAQPVSLKSGVWVVLGTAPRPLRKFLTVVSPTRCVGTRCRFNKPLCSLRDAFPRALAGRAPWCHIGELWR